jgi:hypothetical protein
MSLFLLATLSSWACDGNTDARLVGWGPGGQHALVRVEHTAPGQEGSYIKIETYDVGGPTPRKSWIIRDFGESQKQRAKNWKRTEAELAHLGFTLAADAKPLALDTVRSDAHLSWMKLEDGDVTTRYLVATDGRTSRLLSPHLESSADTVHFAGPWQGHRADWLLFAAVGCGGGEVRWLPAR